jgi:transcription-repair coupling factor (superfamily II helicase)
VDVLNKVGKLPAVRQLPDLLRARGKAEVFGTAGSGAALVAAWLAEELRTPALAICAAVEEAEEFAEDVNLFSEGLACHFPPLEVLPGDVEEPSQPILQARLSVLRHLAFGPTPEAAPPATSLTYLEPGPRTRLVVTSVTALIQPTCSVDELQAGARAVALGAELAPGELLEWLVANGYWAVPQVEAPGQYCLRGGILDAYSHGSAEAVRIEFFADKVDSIRTFEPGTQLSTGRIGRCQFTVAEHPATGEAGAGGNLFSYFGPGSIVILAEPDEVWERAQASYEQAEQRHLLTPPAVLRETAAARPCVSFSSQGESADRDAVRMDFRRRDVFGPDLDSMLAEVARFCEEYQDVVIYSISPAEEDRFRNLLRDQGFERLDRLQFGLGRLNHGVLCPEASLALLPHHRLFGRYRQRRFVPYGHEGRPVESAQDLTPGDLVVHVSHGIGRFVGTSILEQEGRRREHLEIEFAENVHVYVPCDRIEMVHRYVGIGGRHPELSAIRGAGWLKAKQRAEQAVEDLAAELLEMQAVRETQPGIAAPVDTDWQRQFESEFPYEETEDQLSAIAALKRDMGSPRPMDRLICGDVGYGKTEVAMRAAFSAVMGGRQAAVLVPTTVLAQQHYRTFSERMADYPCRIEMLSRFLTGLQTREVLEAMATGKADIVIGTHRLLQPDVTFKDLGLVIIDEEQRFGVEHKERLKKLRATVDVLTLTATPIPRTLHMALMGLKEISALHTPPRDRQAIETRVSAFDPELLRHAILRELNRDGQAFIIHNRVNTIDRFAERVRALVPEARTAVAHGQMPEHQLAETMDRFLEREVDVLISTTIVESGLDIPNVNTIVIDRAELLGLAEMHQLRGRVGRYIHKAYAYFFTPATRPVTPEARTRLDAIRRYSHLGAGFDIALRDLEIRGAGNILGPAQSGHIAAVGYNLYCRLLGRATARLRGEKVKDPPDVTLNIGLDAFLPEDYVPTPRQRMDLYRQLNRAVELGDVEQVERAMRDRFGPPPPEALNLLAEAEIRILAAAAGIDSIHLEDGRLHFGVKDAGAMSRYFGAAARRPRLVAPDLAVLDDGFPGADPEALAEFLEDFLQPAISGSQHGG